MPDKDKITTDIPVVASLRAGEGVLVAEVQSKVNVNKEEEAQGPHVNKEVNVHNSVADPRGHVKTALICQESGTWFIGLQRGVLGRFGVMAGKVEGEDVTTEDAARKWVRQQTGLDLHRLQVQLISVGSERREEKEFSVFVCVLSKRLPLRSEDGQYGDWFSMERVRQMVRNPRQGDPQVRANDIGWCVGSHLGESLGLNEKECTEDGKAVNMERARSEEIGGTVHNDGEGVAQATEWETEIARKAEEEQRLEARRCELGVMTCAAQVAEFQVKVEQLRRRGRTLQRVSSLQTVATGLRRRAYSSNDAGLHSWQGEAGLRTRTDRHMEAEGVHVWSSFVVSTGRHRSYSCNDIGTVAWVDSEIGNEEDYMYEGVETRLASLAKYLSDDARLEYLRGLVSTKQEYLRGSSNMDRGIASAKLAQGLKERSWEERSAAHARQMQRPHLESNTSQLGPTVGFETWKRCYGECKDGHVPAQREADWSLAKRGVCAKGADWDWSIGCPPCGVQGEQRAARCETVIPTVIKVNKLTLQIDNRLPFIEQAKQFMAHTEEEKRRLATGETALACAEKIWKAETRKLEIERADDVGHRINTNRSPVNQRIRSQLRNNMKRKNYLLDELRARREEHARKQASEYRQGVQNFCAKRNIPLITTPGPLEDEYSSMRLKNRTERELREQSEPRSRDTWQEEERELREQKRRATEQEDERELREQKRRATWQEDERELREQKRRATWQVEADIDKGRRLIETRARQHMTDAAVPYTIDRYARNTPKGAVLVRYPTKYDQYGIHPLSHDPIANYCLQYRMDRIALYKSPEVSSQDIHPYVLGKFRLPRGDKEELVARRILEKMAVPIYKGQPGAWNRGEPDERERLEYSPEEQWVDFQVWHRRCKDICKSVRLVISQHSQGKTYPKPRWPTPYTRQVSAVNVAQERQGAVIPHSEASYGPSCEGIGTYQYSERQIQRLRRTGRKAVARALEEDYRTQILGEDPPVPSRTPPKPPPLDREPVLNNSDSEADIPTDAAYHRRLTTFALVTNAIAMHEDAYIRSLPVHNLRQTHICLDNVAEEPDEEEASTNPNANLTYLAARVRVHRHPRPGDRILDSPVNLDSGASITVVDTAYAKLIGAQLYPAKRPVRVKSVDGGITLCRHVCKLYLDISGDKEQDGESNDFSLLKERYRAPNQTNTIRITCVVMPGCSTPLLIGSNTMKWYHMRPNLNTRETHMGRPVYDEELIVPHMDMKRVERALVMPLANMDPEVRRTWTAGDEELEWARYRVQRAEDVLTREIRCLTHLAAEDPGYTTIEDTSADEAEGLEASDSSASDSESDTSESTPRRCLSRSQRRRAAQQKAEEAEKPPPEPPPIPPANLYRKATAAFGGMMTHLSRYAGAQKVIDARVNAAVRDDMPAEEKARLMEEQRKATQANVSEAHNVIDKWSEEDVGDDISELLAVDSGYSHSTDDTGRPELFPVELWPFVADKQKPLVAARWAKYTTPGQLLSMVEDLKLIDICLDRTKTLPYVLAQAFANISRYYQVDEENPETVPDTLFRIRTVTEVPVVVKRTQRWAYLERIFLSVKQADMIRKKQLEPTESPWRSPIMLVAYDDRIKAFMTEFATNPQEQLDVTIHPENRKRIADFFRFTMNMIAVNAVTIPDNHPMPSMADSIEAFQGDTSYSAGDVLDAFWNIKLHPDDRCKTAFATHNMLLQWTVSVQGSKTAANFFARVIQSVFNEAPLSITVFQDDVFVHTKGIKALLDMQQEAFDRMESKCLFFKRSKARLNYPRMKCLGHIITRHGRCPDPSKIEAILKLERPRNARDVRIMMGLVQFNSEYIGNLADILAPLNDISHDDADIVNDWKDAIHGEALRKLKHAFTTAPLLALPDMAQRFRLFVDTSTTDGRGVGGVLTQWYGEGEPNLLDVSGKGWRPVAYYSKLMTKSQRRYGVTEAEAMGMHDCIMRWAPYLLAGEFDVIVDHKALEYIYNSPATTANRRILRYALNLQKFTFRVIYKSGAAHMNADAMSRLYQYGDNVADVDEEQAGNYAVATAEDLALLKAQVKLGLETGLTMTLAEIEKATSRVAHARRIANTSLRYRISQDADYMMLQSGRVMQDTIQREVEIAEVDRNAQLDMLLWDSPSELAAASADIRAVRRAAVTEVEKEQTVNAQVRRVVNGDLIWEDPREVHYVNLDWQGDSEQDTDGDEPTHIYTVNSLTGATAYSCIRHQHECQTCRQSSQLEEHGDLVEHVRAGYATRSSVGDRNRRHYTKEGLQDEDIQQVVPALQLEEAKQQKAARAQERSRIKAAAAAQIIDAAEDKLEKARQAAAQKLADKEEIRLESAANKAEKKAAKVDIKVTREALLAAQKALAKEVKKTERQQKHSEALRLQAEKSMEKIAKAAARRTEERESRKRAKLRRQEMAAAQAAENGPPKVILGVPRSEDSETAAQRQERQAGDELAAAKGRDLIGGIFEHPITGRVYEVMYVFWDPITKLIVANRRSADGEQSTSDDNYAYEVDGIRGVEALVHLFAERAGFTGQVMQ